MAAPRIPRVNLAQLLEEQNPTIELRLDVQEKSMRNFLQALVSFKNSAMTSISERRKLQAAEKKKLIEKTELAQKEISQCKLDEITLVADLEREKNERQEAELGISALQRQLSSLKDRSTDLEGEIGQYRTISANLRRDKDKDRATLSTFASSVSPELIAYEKQLGLKIEGIGPENLLFRFTNINPHNAEQEASFVLDISDSTYKVMTISPNPPAVSSLAIQLLATGDLGAFVRDVHKVFVDTCNS